MDIKNLTTNVAANRNNDSVKQSIADLGENNKHASSMATDKVTLTGVLSQVMDLENQSKNVNIDNSEKIAALKASIQDGSYQVNTQKIAEKLIQTEALFAKA
ncbi:flagellar biosynthesis anti-sigma factor FlgM [Thiomicrorhabdus sp. Kp2]|uniref:flagellar biosynthesis anti-sigma factor FlgM n=1 Tax=Thiomicrorhabdus sp. Kp2 TaxID=1123518 RepID=UPI0003F90453|nr:flagellar biosynthesis anti-sigma factor FlgM [Thiomicrorhabdus sp. Kp2]